LSSTLSTVAVRRRLKKAGTSESRTGADGAGADVGAGVGIPSLAPSAECNELLPDEIGALLSRLSLPLRLKRDLLKIWTLSGRSRDGMALVVDLPEDFLDRLNPSSAFSQDGRSAEASDKREDEPDEVAVWPLCWLWCFSLAEDCLIWLLRARMVSGDGGPSMAGSRRPLMLSESCREWWFGECGKSRVADELDRPRPREYFDFRSCLRRVSRSTVYAGKSETAHMFMVTLFHSFSLEILWKSCWQYSERAGW